MTKQLRSHKATVAAKRFNLHRLMRSAIAAGVVAGCMSNASAQIDLPLPALPSDTSGWSLPVSQDSPSQPTTSSAAASNHTGSTHTAPQFAAKLLGLKKRTAAANNPLASSTALNLPAFTVPTLPTQTLAAQTLAAQTLAGPSSALPTFPSTAPRSSDATQSTSTAPTICCSSGTKSQAVSNDTVVLASAQELPTPPQFSSDTDADSLVPASLDSNARSSQAAVTSSISDNESSDDESLSESLIDIDFATITPPTAPAPVAQSTQRLPELVKRPPAMQLHIGGESSRKVTTATQLQRPQTTLATAPSAKSTAATTKELPANFSLSDTSDASSQSNAVGNSSTRFGGSPSVTIEPVIAVVPSTNLNPMNVRIEGEPGTAKAIASSTPPIVNASTFAKQTVATTAPKTPSTGNSSRNATHKSVSDNSAARGPVIGERLEVDLHEATNVETSRPITGLSIEHPELCQVLKSGERMISLVGLKAGQTRVALFTTDTDGERNIEIRDIVIAGTETRQADMKSMATDISRSVHNMYPNSRIEVIAEAEGLTVQGYASTEDEAKKIISLVRRTSLQPVVDRLATYK